MEEKAPKRIGRLPKPKDKTIEVKEEIKTVEEVKEMAKPTIETNDILEESFSPLNSQPMVERAYAMENPAESQMEQQQAQEPVKQAVVEEKLNPALSTPANNQFEPEPEPFKFVMNDINNEGFDDRDLVNQGNGGSAEPLPEMPNANAKQMADFILGSANFVIPLVGGRFVSVKIQKEFYEVQGFVETINQQNERNLERIKLTKEEIDYLRPILIAVIKEKNAQMTPMGQLLMALALIGAKKTSDVMEIRKENKKLEDTLVEMIKNNRMGKAVEKEEVKKD